MFRHFIASLCMIQDKGGRTTADTDLSRKLIYI